MGGWRKIECLLWNWKGYLFEVLFSGAYAKQKTIITQIYEACLSNHKGFEMMLPALQLLDWADIGKSVVSSYILLVFQNGHFFFICCLNLCTLTINWFFIFYVFVISQKSNAYPFSSLKLECKEMHFEDNIIIIFINLEVC